MGKTIPDFEGSITWTVSTLISESELHEYSVEYQESNVYFITPLLHSVKWMKGDG